MLFHSSISCTFKSTKNSPPNQLLPASLFFLGANFADIALPEMNISPENWVVGLFSGAILVSIGSGKFFEAIRRLKSPNHFNNAKRRWHGI